MNFGHLDLNAGQRPFFARLFSAVALVTLLLSPCASFSQAGSQAASQSLDANFSSGVEAFKAGKLEEARKIFLDLETKYPSDPTLLLNLGVIAQKEKRPGAALALWRKGLVNHPTNEALWNAVDWTRSKLTKSEIAHETDSWEDLRREILIRVSPIVITVCSALFLFFAGWRILAWLGARRRALELETALPPLPMAGFVLSFIALVFIATSAAVVVDRTEIRGTILNEKVEVRSAPDVAATRLFDIFEGMEVIVRESRTVGNEQWRRITYPGGMTGWIRNADILASTDPSARAWEK